MQKLKTSPAKEKAPHCQRHQLPPADPTRPAPKPCCSRPQWVQGDPAQPEARVPACCRAPERAHAKAARRDARLD